RTPTPDIVPLIFALMGFFECACIDYIASDLSRVLEPATTSTLMGFSLSEFLSSSRIRGALGVPRFPALVLEGLLDGGIYSGDFVGFGRAFRLPEQILITTQAQNKNVFVVLQQ